MGSGSLSPIPVKSPPAISNNVHSLAGTTKSLSSPTPSSADLATTGDDSRTGHHHHHNHHQHHQQRHQRHHRSERDDRSPSPSYHHSSRYDERYERRHNGITNRYPQDRHHAREQPTRRGYRDDGQQSKNSRLDNGADGDSYRPNSLTPSESPTAAAPASSSRHHGDSYRPTLLPPTESAIVSSRHHGDNYKPTSLPPSETPTSSSSSSSSRHQDRSHPRFGESRYDTMGRRGDYQSDYNRHHQPSYYSSQQYYHHRERSPYAHRDYRTQEPTQHHHHHHNELYDDRRYQRYDPRPRSTRRTVNRGTEEERQKSTIIFTGNLPYEYCERDVAAMFERYGKLLKITIPIDNVTTRNKGFAFVEFEHRNEAQEAFDNFQGFSVGGRRLKLDWDIGLNKKDTRRTPRSEDYRHTNNHAISSSSSSSSPPNTGRDTDTYIPSHSQV